MSYQALARKWRPGVFADVVGQEHVVQALSNALDRDQVHHAFLFSGTRGVGKTTLARIFAKALNCEQGVSAKPCNECSACTAIDQGGYIDLIEVDAASRTKVDDTRELLDNVQYAPTAGRYKIYLIDEVHMLSGHSFNALLKTLEEPPPHVKFLLATTDPQKLPVTVLSRCLQFHLKALQPDQIRDQLQKIVEDENIEFDVEALNLLARGADGSLRDGLSLLDQGLAYGAGRLDAPSIRNMLGTIEDDIAERILRALIANDAEALLQIVVDLATRAANFIEALDEILLQLYHLSLIQVSPASLRAKGVEQPWHSELASVVRPEELQLFYQIGLVGKRDMALAPDLRTGFEMVLLRMIAFRPVDDVQNQVPESGWDRSSATPPAGFGAAETASRGIAADLKHETGASQGASDSHDQTGETDSATGFETWIALIEQMPINGVTRELAMNLGLVRADGKQLHFCLDPNFEYLYDSERVSAINQALENLGENITVHVEIRKHTHDTNASRMKRQQAARLSAAERSITEDPNVKALQEKLGATIIKESIRVRD